MIGFLQYNEKGTLGQNYKKGYFCFNKEYFLRSIWDARRGKFKSDTYQGKPQIYRWMVYYYADWLENYGYDQTLQALY